jgi:hypothetical protein
MRRSHPPYPPPREILCLHHGQPPAWTPLPPRDSRCFFAPFAEPPMPPFVKGVLSAGSRQLQSTAFQVITGHSFQAEYSDRFHPTAREHTDCPHCSAYYSTTHILKDCDALWEAHGDIIDTSSTPHLFSTYLGGHPLVCFLHWTQLLLRPIPLCLPPGTRPPP